MLVDVWHVLRGPERRAVRLALVIAFIDQAMASTAVVNYAPEARAAPARARPACGRQSLFLLVCLCTAGGGLCAAAMRSVAAPWLNSVLARGADADAGGLAQQRRHAVDVCHRWRQGARPARPDRAGAALRRAPPRRPFPMRARDAARAQIVGVGLTLLLVDSAGRRPLMLCGSAACTGALLLLAAGDWRGSPALMLAAMCLFLLAFSASYAGLFWILCSELFSMQVKASAASAATAMLFAGGARPGTGSCCAQAHGVGRRTCCPCPPAQKMQSACRAPVLWRETAAEPPAVGGCEARRRAGAAADLAFLSVHSVLGAGSFLVFGAVAAAGGVYCWAALPETKGRSLAEVQALLAVHKPPLAAADELAGGGGDAVGSGGGRTASYPALLAAGAGSVAAAACSPLCGFCSGICAERSLPGRRRGCRDWPRVWCWGRRGCAAGGLAGAHAARHHQLTLCLGSGVL